MGLPWQVVTHWITVEGSEYVHVAAFATFAEGQAEARRLCPLVGVLEREKLLRGVQIVGDYAVRFDRQDAGAPGGEGCRRSSREEDSTSGGGGLMTR